MKKLVDGTLVPARIYYYLLDFNERYNWEAMIQFFNKKKLCELNIIEFKKLFEHATDVDKVALL